MPIIREERQYKIGPIGVARAYEGTLTADAIAQGADQRAQYFFDLAAKNAEQKGIELAESVNRDELLTIDPETGQPAALGRVEDMGLVASQAYTRVLQDRYRQSVEEEIRNQATIFAAQYENSNDAVALYQSAMSDYISQMSNNATGMYRGYIEDFGESYISSTSASLTVNQLRRARAEMADGIARSLEEALPSVEGFFAQNGPDGDVELSLGNGIIEGALTRVRDGVDAGVLRSNASVNAERQLAVSRASGIIQYYVNNGNFSAAQIAALNGAIGSQDIAAVRRISPEIADQLEPLSTDFAAFAALESPANNYLRDRVAIAQYDEAQAAELALREDTQLAFKLSSTNSYFGAITSDNTFARFNASGSVGMVAYDTTMQSFTSNYMSLGQAAMTANEKTAESLIARQQELVNANVDGVLRYLLRDGATDERIAYLQAALGPSGGSLPVSQEDRAALRTLRAIDSVVEEDVIGSISTRLAQYKERQSDYFNDEAERQAIQLFNETIEPSFVELRDSRGNGTGQLLDETLQAINNSGLSGTDLESAQQRANFHAMEARLNEMFDYDNLTESQIVAAGKYLSGQTVDADELPQYFRQLLDDAESYWNSSNQRSSLRTEFNSRAQGWREEQRANEERLANQRLQYEIGVGTVDGSLQEVRRAANDRLNTQYRQAFNQDMPNDFFTNPVYLQNEQYAELFRNAYSTPSVVPEFAYNAFRAVASGTFGPDIDVRTVLSHWDQISLHEVDGGARVVRAAGVNALSEREIAILDYMSSGLDLTGASNADIEQIIVDSQRVYRDSNYSENVRAFLGTDYNSLEDYLAKEVDGYTDLSLEDRRSIRARFDAIYSVASVGNRSLGSISTELSRQIDRSFPSGGGVVMAFTPDGRITDRTRYALDAVIPDDVEVFKSLVISGISELAPSVNARFAPSASRFDIPARLTDAISRFIQSGPEDIVASRADYVFLAPTGPSINGETIYGVYQFDPVTSQIRQVPREDEGFEGVPLMFSTSEIQNARGQVSRTSIMRRNQQFRWARTGTEYEGLYDMFDGQVNPDLLLQEE